MTGVQTCALPILVWDGILKQCVQATDAVPIHAEQRPSHTARQPLEAQRSRNTSGDDFNVSAMKLEHLVTRSTFSSNVSPLAARFAPLPSRSSGRWTEYFRRSRAMMAEEVTGDDQGDQFKICFET